MSATVELKEKKRCSYSFGDYHCRFDVEEGKDLCIFHLPVDEKNAEKFWHLLANYLIVLIENTEDDKIKSAYDYQVTGKNFTEVIEKINAEQEAGTLKTIPWIFSEKEEKYYVEYSDKIGFRVRERKKWEFVGFKFPSMDDKHNFSNFIFPDSDFRVAKFSGDSDFLKAQFLGGGYFSWAQFSGRAGFGVVQFSVGAYFYDAQFLGEVDFSTTKFLGDADFNFAQFSNIALFKSAQFSGMAAFGTTIFSGDANFTSAQFLDEADFMVKQFLGDVCFKFAQFSGNVYFHSATFSGEADFSWAQFTGITVFRSAQFLGEVDFGMTKFLGDADFSRVIFSKIVDFEQCEISSFLRLRSIQKFNQTSPPIILLRDLRFWENGHLILEDFDVSRVSFWQTNFHIIRPRIDFIRVDWGNKKTIIDDVFSRQEYKDWQAKKSNDPFDELSLIYDPIEKLSEKSKAEEIERCYRQIRLCYEARGEHPDAGDFYLNEMRARGKRLKKDKKFIWFLHQLYGLVSKFGESPSRALYWFLGIWLFSSTLYLFTGFSFGGYTIYYLPFFELSPTIYYFPFFDIPGIFKFAENFLTKAIWFSFINLIPGYFRFTSQSGQSVPLLTTIISIIEGILGISVLTLFLLAVRRRFRRESQ
jgi:uncharacterized protein YjbI with pentapeptide repeats